MQVYVTKDLSRIDYKLASPVNPLGWMAWNIQFDITSSKEHDPHNYFIVQIKFFYRI